MSKRGKASRTTKGVKARKRGRPSVFTQRLADTICERITLGESLRAICQDQGFPSLKTVMRWLNGPGYEPFRQQYARARELQAEVLFDQILEIADDSSKDTVQGEHGPIINAEVVTRSRLRIDTRKWWLAKVLPKKYGDHVGMEVNYVGGTVLRPKCLDDGKK